MKGCEKIFCLFFLIIFLFGSSYPQELQYQFEHINKTQGLSDNRVNTIIQDSRDFVWIGTNHGLNYFNGYEFAYFDRPGNPAEFTNTKITSLYEDQNGIIWIGTSRNGLYTYDPLSDKFIHYLHYPDDSLSLTSNAILSIYQDKFGTIWIGTKDGGLNQFNAKAESFTAFRPVQEITDYKKNSISSMIEDSEGRFWVGTHEGIYHFDRISENFIPFEIKLNIPDIYQQIFCFYQDSGKNIWIGTLKGLFKYDMEKSELIHIISKNHKNNDHLRDDVIVSIQASKVAGNEVLWIATRRGLIKYSKHDDHFSRFVIDPTTPKSLSNDFINDLYINDNGLLWIATRWSGVNTIDTRGNPFKHVQLKSEEEDLYFSASSFYLDRKGYLWVGACTGGLFKFDPELNKIAQYQYSAKQGFFIDADTPFTNWIDFIYEDSDNVLWVGLGGWGPAIFDRQSESFSFVDFNLPEGHSRPERIEIIYEDQSGTIWFAGDGLFYKDKMENKYDPVNIIDHDILRQSGVYDIFQNSQGDLYFGTLNNGLFCLKYNDRDSMKFCQYVPTDTASRELSKSSFYKINEDVNSILWAASNRGLNKINPETCRYEIINDSSGMFDNGIYQVFGDSKGNLWLRNNIGLIRYQPDKQSIKTFSYKDGLPFDNIVIRYWHQSEDGRIFIGGWLGDGKGFFFFHPDDITDNENIPQIAITEFNIGNNPIVVDSNISAIKHITLKYKQNFFSFRFAALDYANPEKNQYAYYLEGLDKNWIYSGNRRFANYTSVPPGQYTLHVKGSNNDGYWNETGVAVTITILPPPWRTWWAYTIFGILIIGLIYAWRKYDLKRQRLKQDLELEHLEAEKLKELDSVKSRFFANISHEFRTPLTLILGPLQNLISKHFDEKSKQDLNMMQRNALRLQNLINQLLNLSKIESGKMKLQVREENIIALVNVYVQSFESLAKQKKIDLNFKSTEENIPLFIDQDKIEKILFNLLSNAFKFTDERGKIEVEVIPSSSLIMGVTIKISDSGQGIPANNLEYIFDRFYQADDSYSKDLEGTGIGLALTKELVEIHHGKITVTSEFGNGSTFTIILPVGKKHLKPDEFSNSIIKQPASEESTDNLANLEILESDIIPDEKDSQTEFEGKEDKPHLLIIDDNKDLRAYIKEYLKNDYYISEAMDGEEGFNRATEKLPDLILSDVMMPIMDGYAFCEKIKTDERTNHIPVILLTARASSESKIEGLETGADDFITKPFDQQELLIRIKNLILQRNRLKQKFKKEIEFSQISNDQDIISMDQQFIRKAKAVVEKNLSEPEFNVEIFAKEMALSRVQLHRKLKALVDQSATQFIRTIKMNRAAELLLKKSGTVSEIGYDVGFNTLPYFTKCFQEQFGVNPSEFYNHYNNS